MRRSIGQSNAFIDYIGRTRTSHPDFGPPPYGIPYIGVGGNQPRMPITFVDYGSESDTGFGGENGYPIPTEAARSPTTSKAACPAAERAVTVTCSIVDRDRWVLFELFATRWNTGAMGGRIGRGLRLLHQRPAAGGMDVS